MADNQRIDDLRRRVQKDPASIAFAQLAEECRRAGQFDESVEVCRAGLQQHPGYLSARVTLGRALIELNDLDTALAELTTVLKSAPENLAAIRGVAEIYHRRQDLPAALAQYRIALALARNDPDLQRTVDELARQVEPPPPPHSDGLSFEQMQSEFLKLAPPPPVPEPESAAPESEAGASGPDSAAPLDAVDGQNGLDDQKAAEPANAGDHGVNGASSPFEETAAAFAPVTFEPAIDQSAVAEPAVCEPATAEPAMPEPARNEPATLEPATQTIAALDRWLDAIHVARAERGA